jgi:hypothetical protein
MNYATLKQNNPVFTEKSKPVLMAVIRSIGNYVKSTKRQAMVEDMVGRADMGVDNYGQNLKTFDGRCGLIDAYQEVLDGVYYMEKELAETEDDELKDQLAEYIQKQLVFSVKLRNLLDKKYKVDESPELDSEEEV